MCVHPGGLRLHPKVLHSCIKEAGTVLLILGTMLGGKTFCSDTRRTPFPLLVAAGLQWKGKKGQADCEEKWSSHRP